MPTADQRFASRRRARVLHEKLLRICERGESVELELWRMSAADVLKLMTRHNLDYMGRGKREHIASLLKYQYKHHKNYYMEKAGLSVPWEIVHDRLLELGLEQEAREVKALLNRFAHLPALPKE